MFVREEDEIFFDNRAIDFHHISPCPDETNNCLLSQLFTRIVNVVVLKVKKQHASKMLQAMKGYALIPFLFPEIVFHRNLLFLRIVFERLALMIVMVACRHCIARPGCRPVQTDPRDSSTRMIVLDEKYNDPGERPPHTLITSIIH
tara:strand:+ start:49 stop:486 length:438 start_codon:yes stop_codon:yes gene_type:complete